MCYVLHRWFRGTDVIYTIRELKSFSPPAGVNLYYFTNLEVDVADGNYQGETFICRMQVSGGTDTEASVTILGPCE